MNPALRTIDVTWPAPAHVRAAFTTRCGGVSRGPWHGLNLADHVGDAPAHVRANRDLLAAALSLPRAPDWLEQVHGNDVLELDSGATGRQADAAITRVGGRVAAVLVADCLPLLLCDRRGHEVAAVHAGWRGLDAGVIARTVRRFSRPAHELLAWIGPGIGVAAYAVGADLRARFITADAGNASAFVAIDGVWHCDLAALAQRQLTASGVGSITLAAGCVHADAELFYSYRRDGVTGRMAALVWRASA